MNTPLNFRLAAAVASGTITDERPSAMPNNAPTRLIRKQEGDR
ncbi:MAG: hypothetical protein ACXWIZ_10770 [Caldimonas sp.]